MKNSYFFTPKELWEMKGLRNTLLVIYFLCVFSISASVPLLSLILFLVPIWLISDEKTPSTWRERLKQWKSRKVRTGASVLVILMTLIMLTPAPPESPSEVVVSKADTVVDQKTPEELQAERIRAEEEALREQEEREAMALIEAQIVIVSEEDISYIFCNRIAVRVTVPDDAPQRYVDRILNSWKYDYDNDDVTIWAWNESETSQVGKIPATRGTYERSTCDD